MVVGGLDVLRGEGGAVQAPAQTRGKEWARRAQRRRGAPLSASRLIRVSYCFIRYFTRLDGAPRIA